MNELLPCPFCGEEPTLTKKPMWQGSHGYYGCYGYSVKCENEDCAITPFTRTFDTIYEKDGNKQKKKAIAAWNRRADHLPDATKKVSNADRIRGMSDEELAGWVFGKCQKQNECCNEPNKSCKECTLDWLRQPVKEEHNETD